MTPASRWRSLRPRWYEVLIILNTVAVAAVIVLRGVPRFRYFRSMLAMGPYVVHVGWFVLAGMAVRAILATGGSDWRRAGRYLKEWWAPGRALDALRILVAWAIASWGYLYLKLFVPVLNRRSWDAAFSRLDSAIHFGIDPNRFAIEILPYPSVWRFVDTSYGLFVPILVALFGWFVSTLDLRERARFATGFTLLWLGGAWLYLALPALGPCYAYPSTYRDVRPHIGGVVTLQSDLIRQYAKIRDRNLQRGETLNPGYGVAAMPSLHVGGLAFLALWARRRWRALWFVTAALTALIFFGSLVTGWHYAVDGYVGAALAGVCVLVGSRLEPTLGRG